MKKIFISYSHKDEKWKERVVTHLGVLQELEVWDDRKIEAGEDWFPEIEKAINESHAAILLITANFLTSQFILNVEIPRLLKRRAKEGMRVFPLIIKPCAWDEIRWLKNMQVRPKDGRPLSGGTEHQKDTDLAAFAKEIKKLLRVTESPKDNEISGTVPPEKVLLAKLPTTNLDLLARADFWRQR